MSSEALAEARGCPWWLWPNVLSLDAAIVAVIWQAAFAKIAGVSLLWGHHALLFCCAWLAYCGDRLLDARRLCGPVNSARHEFARCHAWPLSVMWVGALICAGVLASRLTMDEILAGTVLLMGVGGYFWLQHHPVTRRQAGRWKELLAGVGFALGSSFFTTIHKVPTAGMTCIMLAWAGVCALNCLIVASGDRRTDTMMGQISLAQSWKGFEGRVPVLTGGLIALAGLGGLLDSSWWPLTGCVAVATLAMNELARRGEDLSPDIRRVWADGVLLLPGAWLIFS